MSPFLKKVSSYMTKLDCRIGWPLEKWGKRWVHYVSFQKKNAIITQYEFDEERKAKLEALQREQAAKEREKVALAEKQPL